MKAKTPNGSDEWYTPQYIFDALGAKFDLDVAAPRSLEFIKTPAKKFIHENSLSKNWTGFVWCNPPFKGTSKQNKILWVDKFFEHGSGVLLLPDSTSAAWWQLANKRADLILFTDHRIKFVDQYGIKGNSPANGTTLFAAGKRGVKALNHAQETGLGVIPNFKKIAAA